MLKHKIHHIEVDFLMYKQDRNFKENGSSFKEPIFVYVVTLWSKDRSKKVKLTSHIVMNTKTLKIQDISCDVPIKSDRTKWEPEYTDIEKAIRKYFRQ